MKKRKLLFLMVLVLCASLLLTACNSATADSGNKGNDLSNDSTGGNGGTPEMLSWFLLDPTEEYYYHESVVFTSAVERDDGDNVSYIGDYRIEKKSELNKYDDYSVQVKVYYGDTDTVVASCSTSYSNGGAEAGIDVTIWRDLLVFGYMSGKTAYTSIYYLNEGATSATGLLTGSNAVKSYGKEGNFYYIERDKDITWYKNSGGSVFTATKAFYDSYDLEATYAVNDNLYWVGTNKMHIYNNNTCVVEYLVSPDCADFSAFVLNDGNVIVQEKYIVDGTSAEYDDLSNGVKYNVVSKIVNAATGAETPMDIDFEILQLEPASNHESEGSNSHFPFELVEGKQNQAYIRAFDKTGATYDQKYVVINNSLEVEYEFNNKAPNLLWSDLRYARILANDKYAARVAIGNEKHYMIFDAEGNEVAPYNSTDIFEPNYNDKYIVTFNAVYDKNMNLVYDFADNGVELWRGDYNQYFIGENSVVVYKDADSDGYYEDYRLNFETKELTLLADEVRTVLCDYGDSYYVIKEYCDECTAHIKTCACAECEYHKQHVYACTDETRWCDECQDALAHYESCEKFAEKRNDRYTVENMYYIIDHLQTCERGDSANLNYIGAIGRHKAQFKHVADFATECDKCQDSCDYCDNCIHTLYNIEGKVLVTARGCMSVTDDYVAVNFEGKRVYFDLVK